MLLYWAGAALRRTRSSHFRLVSTMRSSCFERTEHMARLEGSVPSYFLCNLMLLVAAAASMSYCVNTGLGISGTYVKVRVRRV